MASQATDPEPVFYYDLGSAESYLVAERISATLPVVAEWEPVLASELGIPLAAEDPRMIERLAAEYGLQQLRWPSRSAVDTREAMLVATYAKRIGRAVSFSLAAFRQAFAGGRELDDRDTVLIAAAACEMHPAAVIKALETRSVAEALGEAMARARRAGVERLPAIQLGDRVLCGDRGLERAAALLR